MKYNNNQINNNFSNVMAKIGYFSPGLHFLVFTVISCGHLLTQHGMLMKHLFMEYISISLQHTLTVQTSLLP